MWKYCNSISILSSICFHFFSFSFFSCFFSRHTCSHISHPLLFFFFRFFSQLSTSRTYISISFSNSLLFYSFSFLFLPLSSNTHRQAWRERRNRPCSATAASPPHHYCSTTHIRLYFFSWSFIVVLFFFFCSWSVVVVVLILDLLFKLNQFFMRARIFLWKQELFCEKKQIKEERERSDKILSVEIF